MENKDLKPIWSLSFTITNTKIEEELSLDTYFGQISVKDNSTDNNNQAEITIITKLENNDFPIAKLEGKLSVFLAGLLPFHSSQEFRSIQRIFNIRPENLNFAELTKAKIETKTLFKFEDKANLILNQPNIEQIAQNMEIIESLPKKIKNIMSIFNIAILSDNQYSILIHYWTCFEMIYRFNSSGADTQLIKEYIHSIPDTLLKRILFLAHPPLGERDSDKNFSPMKQHLKLHWGGKMNTIAEALISLDLWDKDRNVNFSSEIKIFIETYNCRTHSIRKLISLVFRCFYSIRSNLVHGNNEFYDRLTERKAIALNIFLKSAIGNFVNNLIFENKKK